MDCDVGSPILRSCVSGGSIMISVVVLRRFGLGEFKSSEALFLHLLWRVPGRLSGPLRLGIASYSHSLFLRRQLLHSGLVESHRILRARLRRIQVVKKVRRSSAHQ